MEISGISSATLASYASIGSRSAAVSSPAEAGNTNLNVQDEITMSVINQIQDQQQVMANGLIGMMKQTIDIYA